MWEAKAWQGYNCMLSNGEQSVNWNSRLKQLTGFHILLHFITWCFHTNQVKCL